MLTTPIYGIPYAEKDDPAREYPETVNAPASTIIETQLAVAHRQPIYSAKPTTTVSGLVAGWNFVPFDTVLLNSDATRFGASAGGLLFNKPGLYRLDIRVSMGSAVSRLVIAESVAKTGGGDNWLYDISGISPAALISGSSVIIDVATTSSRYVYVYVAPAGAVIDATRTLLVATYLGLK